MNGPHMSKEPKPELRIEAHFDSFGEDPKYVASRKKRLDAKQKALKAALKDMTAEKAHKMAIASIERELKRCEVEAMEFEDGPSIGEAYEDKE
jgi:hypothetical protein